jgi:DNA-binding Lrp family transcriptional regulator
VLRLVGERPGISVSELGKELGVDPTGLYQIVRRLEARGLIRKEGMQLQPVAAESAAADQEVRGSGT